MEFRAPVSGLKITVEEAFLHCAKALIRARLWDVDSQINRASYPTYGEVLADQIAGSDAVEIDAGEAVSCRTNSTNGLSKTAPAERPMY